MNTETSWQSQIALSLHGKYTLCAGHIDTEMGWVPFNFVHIPLTCFDRQTNRIREVVYSDSDEGVQG